LYLLFLLVEKINKADTHKPHFATYLFCRYISFIFLTMNGINIRRNSWRQKCVTVLPVTTERRRRRRVSAVSDCSFVTRGSSGNNDVRRIIQWPTLNSKQSIPKYPNNDNSKKRQRTRTTNNTDNSTVHHVFGNRRGFQIIIHYNILFLRPTRYRHVCTCVLQAHHSVQQTSVRSQEKWCYAKMGKKSQVWLE